MPKRKDHVLTLKLDTELYEFFKKYCKESRETMAGNLKRYVLSLKREVEAQQGEREQA